MVKNRGQGRGNNGRRYEESGARGQNERVRPRADRKLPRPWRDDRGLGAALERGRNARGKWRLACFRGESVETISRKLRVSRYST
jgi:hypothetical protein